MIITYIHFTILTLLKCLLFCYFLFSFGFFLWSSIIMVMKYLTRSFLPRVFRVRVEGNITARMQMLFQIGLKASPRDCKHGPFTQLLCQLPSTQLEGQWHKQEPSRTFCVFTAIATSFHKFMQYSCYHFCRRCLSRQCQHCPYCRSESLFEYTDVN